MKFQNLFHCQIRSTIILILLQHFESIRLIHQWLNDLDEAVDYLGFYCLILWVLATETHWVHVTAVSIGLSI